MAIVWGLQTLPHLPIAERKLPGVLLKQSLMQNAFSAFALRQSGDSLEEPLEVVSHPTKAKKEIKKIIFFKIL